MNRNTSSGFTLIELMIVVAIIAIIAAIAIPSILRSRISANQTSAVASLDTVLKMNTQFRSNDSDANGENDYWAENVWGLYGVQSAGGNRIELFSRTLAASDWEGYNDDYGSVTVATFEQGDISPKSGYHVAMFGGFQNQGNKGAASGCDNDYTDSAADNTNDNRFATMAFPDLYDSTGTKAYIVDQGGSKYEIDAKSGDLDVQFNGNTSGSEDDPNSSQGTAPMECKPGDDPLTSNWGTVG